MLVTVLLASHHRFTAVEHVLAELDEARRALEPSGVSVIAHLLGASPDEVAGPKALADRLGLPLGVVNSPSSAGFAAALLDGFRAALAGGADVVVSLDADGQHDPRQIPTLVRSHLARSSGLTIGSRWVRGGSSPGTGILRSVASRAGNAAVMLVTGARGVSDSTTSFRAYSPDVLEVLLSEDLPSETYGFFCAMVAVVQAHGFAVDEVPITFRPRYAAFAEVGREDLREFARNLAPIRQRVLAIRKEMRTNQTQWAQRSPRLRAQAAAGQSVFGATVELANLSDADRFLTWISDELRPHLGKRVLEVGAGVGAIATKLADAGHEVMAIEPADNVFPELAARTKANPRVTALQVTSQELLDRASTPPFDSVVYVSVMEHILDDVAELRTAAQLVEPGGTIAMFVPALPALYGSLDYKSGHYRRYDRDLLRSVIEQAGLELVESKYMDVAGVVPYFLMYRVLNVQRLHAGSSKVFDSLIVPVSRFLQRRVGSPAVGKNLLAVARRPRHSCPPA